MSENIIVQLVGFMAVGISLSVFQINNRKTMLYLCTLAAGFYTLHFFLLGAATGAAMNAISGVRSYVYFKIKPSKRHTWILMLFLALSVIGAGLTWQGALSLLPLGGSLFASLAYWHKNPKFIRRWMLAPPPLWFAYNAVSGSYPGMMIEIIMFSSNLVGQYRFDIRHKLSLAAHGSTIS